MRSPTDALRSIARYVALALGPEWEVRLSSEKGVFHRPYARVVQIPAIEFIPVRLPVVKVMSAVQVVLFPKAGTEADGSQLNALAAVDAMWTAFSGPGVDAGRTERIPLYDYAEVPLTGPDAFATEANRDPRDFMKLEAPPNVVPTTDPGDELLWSVTVNLRVSWLRSASRPSTAPTVVDVPVGPSLAP